MSDAQLGPGGQLQLLDAPATGPAASPDPEASH